MYLFFNAQYDVKIVKEMCTAKTQTVFDIKIYVYRFLLPHYLSIVHCTTNAASTTGVSVIT